MRPPANEPWVPADDADAGYAAFVKDRRIVVDDGTTIAYTVRNAEGPRPAVLLASGWSCSDSYWVDLEPRLVDRGHPVVIPDTRGHGRSGLPRHPGRGAANLRFEDLSVPRLAADLIAVLGDAGFDEAVLIGHSMGVQTALDAYRQAPEQFLALALIAGTYENPLRSLYGSSLADRVFPLAKLSMRWTPEVLTPLWLTIGNKKVGHFGARLARAAGPKATPDAMHPYLLHLRTREPAVMVRSAESMRRHSAAELLPTITAPTLILAAGKDVFTPVRCSAEMHRRIPDSELIVYPDGHHTLPIEEPGPIADALEDFLARRGVVGTDAAPTPGVSTTARSAAEATGSKGTAGKRSTAASRSTAAKPKATTTTRASGAKAKPKATATKRSGGAKANPKAKATKRSSGAKAKPKAMATTRPSGAKANPKPKAKATKRSSGAKAKPGLSETTSTKRTSPTKRRLAPTGPGDSPTGTSTE